MPTNVFRYIREGDAEALRSVLRDDPAAARSVEAVALLLEHGAEIDAGQRGGYTALHSAAHSGDGALVDLLLARGAARDPAADDDSTPRALAEQAGHHAIVERLVAS